MTQNKYPEALMIEPMKINKIPEGKEHMFPSLCESGEYFAQMKKDGYWYMFERTENHCYLFSRTVSATDGLLVEKGDNVPHITETLSILPPGTILIGEIYYPGKRSKDVTPIMGSSAEKAKSRQYNEGYGYLHYYIHDIIRYKGQDLTSYGASVRYEILKSVYFQHLLMDYYVDNESIPFLELAARYDENIQEETAHALSIGEEGMVLKKKTAPYTPGKRPAWDTIKIKKTDTCDAVCMGWCEPTVFYNGKLDVGKNYSGSQAAEWPFWGIVGKDDPTINLDDIYRIPYDADRQSILDSLGDRNADICPLTKPFYYGWVTSMRVGAYDENGVLTEIGTISSGLDDELRASAAEYPIKYLGKVVELAGMEKDREAHTLRHFHFKRFRDDKNPADCTFKEIF